jgi:hypothetical protein
MQKQFIDYFTDQLYEINKKLKPDGPLKIKPKAKKYLLNCLENGNPVNILTQCCMTKYLEVRKIKQNGILTPVKSEIKLWKNSIPEIINLFKNYGFSLNWIFAFTRSDSDRTRANDETENEFKKMYKELSKNIFDILLLDWEDEFLNKRILPAKEILDNFNKYVKPTAFEMELKRRYEKTLETIISEETIDQKAIEQDVREKISIIANEGKIITEELFPDGLIIIPTEEPERFDFCRILVPDFKENLICILKTSPWRLES